MEIIINSFKYDGKWYQLNQVPREINSKYLFKDLIHDYEMTQEILAHDFEHLGFSNVTYEMGEDFSMLVYDLHSDTLRAAKHFHEFPYICAHKRTDKPGKIIYHSRALKSGKKCKKFVKLLFTKTRQCTDICLKKAKINVF